MLSRHSAVVLGCDLIGGDGVAVRDVAARAEGVPDGKVKATLGGLVDGPCVGDVVGTCALLDLRQLVRALQESAAVVGGEDGV